MISIWCPSSIICGRKSGKGGERHEKEGRVWHDYNCSWSTTKTENEKCFALHNYTYCRVSSCISWCCGWSEFPLPRREFGIERDDEKHNFMVYGNLPPATGTPTIACNSLVQHKHGCFTVIRWVTYKDTPTGLTLKTQYIVPKNEFLNHMQTIQPTVKNCDQHW